MEAGEQASYDKGKFNVVGPALSGMRGVLGVLFASACLGGFFVFLDWSKSLSAAETAAAAPPRTPESMWRNPATQTFAFIPAGWMVKESKNEEGQAVHTFQSDSGKELFVFASEEVDGDFDMAAYGTALTAAVKGNLELAAPGRSTTVQGAPAWTTTGHMAASPEVQVAVTVVRLERTYWRTIRFGRAKPSTRPLPS